MDTSTSAPSNTTSPKLIVREAMKRISSFSNGYNFENEPQGQKNLFYLAKRFPELLQELIDHWESAPMLERGLWKELVGREVLHHAGSRMYDLTPEKVYAEYKRWLAMFPFLSPLVDNHGNSRVALITIMKRTKEVVGNLDVVLGYSPESDNYLRLKAAMFIGMVTTKSVYSIYPSAQQMESLGFVMEHLDEVYSLFHELSKRETADQGVIESLLSSTSSLQSGAL